MKKQLFFISLLIFSIPLSAMLLDSKRDKATGTSMLAGPEEKAEGSSKK